MKENKAFRIPLITKNQLKSSQALHRIFLKLQYKTCRGSSILYFKASFSDVPSFSKMSQPPGQNQQMVLNSVVYHPCPSRIAFGYDSIFLVHIASKFQCIITLYMYIFHCNSFEHFCECSYSCKLFVIIFYLLTSSDDALCIWCFTLRPCYMYRVLSHVIDAVTK